MATDCKSVDESLRRFESSPLQMSKANLESPDEHRGFFVATKKGEDEKGDLPPSEARKSRRYSRSKAG